MGLTCCHAWEEHPRPAFAEACDISHASERASWLRPEALRRELGTGEREQLELLQPTLARATSFLTLLPESTSFWTCLPIAREAVAPELVSIRTHLAREAIPPERASFRTSLPPAGQSFQTIVPERASFQTLPPADFFPTLLSSRTFQTIAPERSSFQTLPDTSLSHQRCFSLGEPEPRWQPPIDTPPRRKQDRESLGHADVPALSNPAGKVSLGGLQTTFATSVAHDRANVRAGRSAAQPSRAPREAAMFQTRMPREMPKDRGLKTPPLVNATRGASQKEHGSGQYKAQSFPGDISKAPAPPQSADRLPTLLPCRGA